MYELPYFNQFFKYFTSHFQLVLYFMWAGIQIFASILMLMICKKVQKPLDDFKAKQEENVKDGALVLNNIALEETNVVDSE